MPRLQWKGDLLKPRVMFFDRGDEAGYRARAFAQKAFTLSLSEPEYIINFMGTAILPESVWGSAKIAALNFHPGPPEHPGIGCANWALYLNAREFGVTCHHIRNPVDSGPIVAVDRFPIVSGATVEDVIRRAHDQLLVLFYRIADQIITGAPLPASAEVWARKARTRRELNELATITDDMNAFEVDRRIRATSFGSWKPELLFRGRRWGLLGL